jgi:16S rRNA (guanine(966)-N(2))-methyltransferase RsmD
VREAIFNILGARGPAPERVLDLYAGSGALGLEALSRGAREVVLVDKSPSVTACIEANARALGFAAQSRVVCGEVLAWLRRAAPAFGWVFLDPPYAGDELGRALALVDERALLESGGVAVAEHSWREPPAERYGALALSDSRRYGQTAVSFFEATT